MTLPLRVSVDVSAIPPVLTGVGRYVTGVLGALGDDDGIEPVLVARRGDRDRWAPFGPVRAMAPGPRPLRLAWEQLRLPRILRNEAVAVHHSPHYTMPERAPVPVVVTIHDLTFFDHPEWHQRTKAPVFRRAIRRATVRAAALICDSHVTAERLRERFPLSVPTHVVPLGVDHDRFTPDGDEAGDLNALAAAGIRPPYVAFLGTLEPRKGLGTLVAAFSRMAGVHGALTLVIAGRCGWGDTGLDAALAASAHADRVVRAGYLPLALVPAFLRRAAAVAYPSHDEGFGLPVLEAMACGAPVVTSAGTVMAEVAGDGALLVPPGGSGPLADALGDLVGGGPAVAELQRRAIARARGFTWARSAAGHAAVYRSVG